MSPIGSAGFTAKTEEPLAVYFSVEFSLTECSSIFAGGLRVLSGDHLKLASVSILIPECEMGNRWGWEAYRPSDPSGRTRQDG